MTDKELIRLANFLDFYRDEIYSKQSMLYKRPEFKSYTSKDLLEVLGPCQNQYTTSTYYTTTGNSAVNVDGYVWSDNWVYSDIPVYIGDSSPNNTTAKGFVGFDISSIAGRTVVSATLRVYQAENYGGGAPYTTLGNVFVDHVNFGSSLDAGDYSATALTSDIGTISSNATFGWKTLDVSRYVQADIDASRTSSQFRLHFQTDTDNDGQWDLVGFESSENSLGTGNTPQLVVTYR